MNDFNKLNIFKNVDISSIQFYIDQLLDEGYDFALNYTVAYSTWMEIRRARGAIVQSVLDDKDLDELGPRERVFCKLDDEEIDRLCNLVTLAAMNCGGLFWTVDLIEDNKLVEIQRNILDKMNLLSYEVISLSDYTRFFSSQVLYTFNSLLLPYLRRGPSDSDNLGVHFSFLKRHPFLDGISISKLQKRTKDNTSIVVLASSASSGVLEAGIYAHYMSKVLHIPTTVDPVFFVRGSERITMNSTKPPMEVIVIPFDDQILGEGYSPLQARKGAIEKYGGNALVMSPYMKSL